MRLVLVLFAFLAVTLTTGCGSMKSAVTESMANDDCSEDGGSNFIVYRTSTVRDQSGEVLEFFDRMEPVRECAGELEDEWGRLMAEAEYLHNEAKADRLADVKQWGRIGKNRNGEETCPMRKRVAQFWVDIGEFNDASKQQVIDCGPEAIEKAFGLSPEKAARYYKKKATKAE